MRRKAREKERDGWIDGRKKEEPVWYMKDGWKRKIKRAGGERERDR